MHTLKEFIHKVLCEADEADKHKAQDIRAVFSAWIERFGTEYAQVAKDKGYTNASLNIEENESFIYVLQNFNAWYRNDYFIIAQRKSDRHILVVNALARSFALPFAFAFAFALAHVGYYKGHKWLYELASIEHLKVAMAASDNLEEFYALCKAMGM